MGKKLIINGLIIVWAVAAGVMVSLRPWQVYRKEGEDAKVRVKAMHEFETDRDRLSRSVARHESSIGHEEDARSHGYLGPGEVASDTGKS